MDDSITNLLKIIMIQHTSCATFSGTFLKSVPYLGKMKLMDLKRRQS